MIVGVGYEDNINYNYSNNNEDYKNNSSAKNNDNSEQDCMD